MQTSGASTAGLPAAEPAAERSAAQTVETARQAALAEDAILDTAPEADFDDLVRLATQIAGVPAGAISLKDGDRVWFKARVGIEPAEMPPDHTLCAAAIEGVCPLILPDLQQDPAWAGHPAAAWAGWRFYAGVPLRTGDGLAVGVLCLMDRQPRTLRGDQIEALQVLARQVVTHLELRRNLRRLGQCVANHTRSEAALQLAETRFRSLFEHVGQGIFQTTADGHYLAANTALARIYGYDSPEELRAAVQDIRGQLYVEPGRRDEFIRLMREQGAVRHFESQVRRKDGSVIWISENAHAVYDAAGQFLYYEGTLEDITERKAAEEALRNSELLYHSLVESLPQNIFRKDREGRFTFVNQVFCQTIKHPREHILGRTDADFFPPEKAAAYRADDLRVMNTGRPLEKIEEHVKPDGTTLYVHVIKTPLKDAAGRVIGVQGIFWDETERYRMEADLAYERDLLRALLDTVPDAIYFKDLHSRFIRASRALAEKFGVADPQELRGKTDFHFFTSEHALPAYEDEQRIIRTGEPVLNKTERESWPDGRETWVRTSKIPYRNRSGRIIGTLGISKDITDLIRAERNLEKARDDALQAARLKEAILANMSHQLRTPLHSILGTADLLLRSPLTAEQHPLARQIRDGAETLLGVIENLLDQARLAAGQVRLEHLAFDLHEQAEGTVELLALTAGTKELELACWIHPDVPRTVWGDPTRLRQVLLKLLGNAIKFTPRGEVILRLGPALSPAADKVRVRFEVQDTGIGIEPERRARIFEPFQQADDSTPRHYGGSGLGLTIARDLVRLMHGELQVDTRPGEGSTFAFEAEFGAASSEPSANAAPPAPDLRGRRVLVADDHAPSRRILLQTLRGRGVVASEADTGDEALRQLREAAAAGTPYEAVLLDATLGSSDGLALAAAIRSDPSLGTPRLILLTPLGQWLNAGQMRLHGVDFCLIKPTRTSRLLAALAGATAEDLPAPPDETALPLPEAGPPMQVVVAEDHPFNQRLIVEQLKRLGHTVHTAANGQQLLELLEQAPADVVLLDCDMPELDGYETARRWRQREAVLRESAPDQPPPPLYLIALTARAQPGERERCLAAGMNDHLTKPLRLEDLAAALRRAAASRERPTSGEVEPPPAPHLDRTILHAVEDDPALRGELIALFEREGRERLERLSAAVRRGDLPTLRAGAHSLKGSALNLGALRLAQLAEALETAPPTVLHPDIGRERIRTLEEEFQRVCQSLHAPPPPGAA